MMDSIISTSLNLETILVKLFKKNFDITLEHFLFSAMKKQLF